MKEKKKGNEMDEMMDNGTRVYKAAALYTREYGKAAYQAWLAREAEITALAKTGKLPPSSICGLRERNFRLMKAEGSRPTASAAARRAA